MVMVTAGGKTFGMDGYLKSNLDIAKEVVRKDWDMFFVIDGTEGGGKSVMAQQIAGYCDPTFCLERIVFTPKQFKDCIGAAEQYQAVIYDEAYGGLGSRGTMTQVNITIVKMLTEIRRKNLIVLVVLPSFFDLDRYVAIWRSRALIHVYAGEGFQRGNFCFYNTDQKKALYLLGRKLYDYRKPRPAFYGRFSNHYTVNEKDYKQKKIDSSLKDDDEARILVKKTATQLRETVAVNLTRSDLALTQIQKAGIMNITARSIRNYLKKFDVKDKGAGIIKD